MRTRTTLILLLLVVALGSFVLVYERHQASTLEKRNPGPLLGLNPGEITSIEIKNVAGSVKLKLRESDSTWFLTEPLDDRVDPMVLDRLMWLAEKAPVAEELSRKELKSSDIKEMGLDEAGSIQVAFRKEGKTIQKILVGRAGTMGESFYVSIPDDADRPNVYLLYAKDTEKDTNVRDVLTKPASAMRDPMLLPFKTADVVKLSVRRASGGELEVERRLIDDKQSTPWLISKPLKARGNQSQIDDFIGLFCNTVPNLLAPGITPPGLEKPAAELTFWRDPANKGHTLRFFQPPAAAGAAPLLFGYAADRKAWFQLTPDYLEAIPQNVSTFRSGTLANIDPKKVSTVLIDEPGKGSVKMYKVGEEWLLHVAGNSYVKGSEEQVKRTVDKLNNAEIAEFVTDSLTDASLYGLNTPYLTATFSSVGHPSLEKLGSPTPQDSVTLLFGIGPDQRMYANFKGEASVFKMLPEHINLIPSLGNRWRDPQLLTFSPMQVTHFKQSLGAAPAVEFERKSMNLNWASATRSGADVLPLLDRIALDSLLSHLSRLSVAEWLPVMPEAHAALQNPTLDIELSVVFQETPTSDPQTKAIRLMFAPVGEPKSALFFYGKCSDVPDFFRISRESYEQLARPLLKSNS